MAGFEMPECFATRDAAKRKVEKYRNDQWQNEYFPIIFLGEKISGPDWQGELFTDMRHRFSFFFVIFAFFFAIGLNAIGPAVSVAGAAAYHYTMPVAGSDGKNPMPVIGFIDTHRVEEGQTIHNIARMYGLGYNQMVLYHPDIDPWIPEAGKTIDIPSKWILPPTRREEVVINIPEMRLYRFFKDHEMVKTYPIGIGREGANTPIGEASVSDRIKQPSWTVPVSAQEEHGRKVVPPGPDNPLGNYWVGLSVRHIGIHGTNFPWGVGRRVSHGCIRLYPEHIEQLYRETRPGTRVEIIYEPVKVGMRGNIIFLEVHPDVYERMDDMEAHAWSLLQEMGLNGAVDPEAVSRVVAEQKGAPAPVNKGS